MEFTQTNLTIRPETIERQKPVFGLSLDQMNAVRFFCIQLLKSQDLMLWQKLALLGLFCESLTEALKRGGQKQTAEITESMRTLVENGQFEEVNKDG